MIIERRIEILQTNMFDVLFRKNGILGWYMPVDAQIFILDTDTSIRFWSIEVISLVLEDSRFA